MDSPWSARQAHARPYSQPFDTPGMPPQVTRFCVTFLTSFIASILVIFLHKLAALQVIFTTKKEAEQLEFIKSPKSAICANLSSFGSQLPDLDF